MLKRLSISGIVMAISALGFLEAAIYGFSFPYFSLVLAEMGLSPTMIGLNTTLGALSVPVIGLIAPRLMLRLGYRRFAMACFALAALAFGGLLVGDLVFLWFAMRLILGLSFGGLWIVTEAWLNHVVADAQRGRWNAAFQMIYSIGFLAGPSLTYVVGFGRLAPLLTIIAIATLGFAIAGMAREEKTTVTAETERVDWSVAWRGRELIAIALLAGTVEAALYTLLPIFGMAGGLPQEQSVGLLVALSIGAIGFALPLGWAADRYHRRGLLAGCAGIAAGALFLLPLAIAFPLPAWLLTIAAGGTIIGLYNLALIVLGESFTGRDLPVAASAFSMGYAIGSAIGGTLGGLVMDGFGNAALPITCGALLLIYALMRAARIRAVAQSSDNR